MDTVSRVGGGASPEVLKVLRELKAQMDGMQPKWEEVASTTQNGTWTISGCTPGKPLFIILRTAESYRVYGYMTPISGVLNCDAGGDSLYLLGGSGNNSSTNVAVLIPSSSAVAVKVFSLGSGSLHAYN